MPIAPRASSQKAPAIAFIALAAATFAFLLWVTRDTTFMQDEWDFIQTRQGNDNQSNLRPQNNHLFASAASVANL